MTILMSSLANGLGLAGIGIANLVAPSLFASAVNSVLTAVGLGALTFPEDGTGDWAKLASFSLMYIGTMYIGLGLKGARDFAAYSVTSRLFVYPVSAAICVATCGVPPSVIVAAFLDVPCALWCRSELMVFSADTMEQKVKAEPPKKPVQRVSRKDTKMVLVVNKDLKMKKGKIAAQCCHAAVGVLEDIPEDDPDLLAWQRFGCAKVALRGSFEEMKRCGALASADGLPTYIVSDAGRTQIPAGSLTVCAIGPASVDRIDKITGRGGSVPLSLL